MSRSKIFWRAGAALYTVVNVGGMVIAAGMGEPLHASLHAALMFVGLGGYVMWKLSALERRQALPQQQPGDERLDYLQQSVDAIALEVERIGEAQRFTGKLRAGQGDTVPIEQTRLDTPASR
ncbi:MAG TPA: hypothetical protein VHM24_06385 [Gemmatimonadaceae bacterium]|nr:hypothetical protein [Gemmatimonadaceae bacterium]